MKIYLVTGSILILLSILLGWIIVAGRYLKVSAVRRMIKDDVKLVKCHLEFIVMALLMFAFFLLNIGLPAWLAYPACIGAGTNPSLLIVMAVNPDTDTGALSPFGILSACSFLITTAGIGGSAVWMLYLLAR